MDPLDTFDRPLRDLRISVTDRCNLRCAYCMPREVFGPDYAFLPRSELLTYEELSRLAGIFVGHGVGKVRITGGEPLVRRDLHRLVAGLRAAGPELDLAITTNGLLLGRHAEALAAAGLARATVSLDSLDDATFKQMSDTTTSVSEVLAGIEVAATAGLSPIKVNAVIVKGVNDHGVLELATYFRELGHVVRFIEYMDVGNTNGWRRDLVVPAHEILERIGERYPLEPVEANYRGEVARRWRYVDGGGEIGIIASVTAPFCGDCSRARISAEGVLYTCLFASEGLDLRAPLRAGASDEEVSALIAACWSSRQDRYSEIRSENTVGLPRIEMSYIGG
jgi:cyclic pyranopterin phosphate synthase